ncbi:MAG: hypothetical protein JKY17_05190 [Magnetovibrio sp.]|nr:hypothetical protein [Magnetovibrio sp.]
MNPKLQVGVFLNQVLHVSLDRGIEEMKALMIEFPTLTFMKSSLTTLASYQKASGEGLGVTEIDRPGKAKSQILGLVAEILSLENKERSLNHDT